MTPDNLNLVAAVFAFLAAILWLVSATVQVTFRAKTDADGWEAGGITSEGKDVIETGKLQQKWSRYGALAAAAAAALQGIALLMLRNAI